MLTKKKKLGVSVPFKRLEKLAQLISMKFLGRQFRFVSGGLSGGKVFSLYSLNSFITSFLIVGTVVWLSLWSAEDEDEKPSFMEGKSDSWFLCDFFFFFLLKILTFSFVFTLVVFNLRYVNPRLHHSFVLHWCFNCCFSHRWFEFNERNT